MPAPANAPAPIAAARPVKRVKLSFKEQRELDSLPAEIEKLEAEQKAVQLTA
jgi:ATP-binding cassette subfamily F protein uup